MPERDILEIAGRQSFSRFTGGVSPKPRFQFKVVANRQPNREAVNRLTTRLFDLAIAGKISPMDLEENLKSIKKMCPGLIFSEAGFLALAKLHSRYGGHSEAVRVLRDGLRQHSQSMRLMSLLAGALFLNGQEDGALKIYKALENRKPEDPNVILGIGRCLGRLGNVGGALECFEKVIKKQKKTIDGYFDKAALQVMSKDYAGCIQTAELGLNLVGKSAELYFLIAMAKIGLRDIEGALGSFDTAVETNPKYFVAWRSKGDLLVQFRQFGPAIDAYEAAMKVATAGSEKVMVGERLEEIRKAMPPRMDEVAFTEEVFQKLTSCSKPPDTCDEGDNDL